MSAPTLEAGPVGAAGGRRHKRPSVGRRVEIPRVQQVAQTAAGLVALGLLWQLAVTTLGVPSVILPPLTEVLAEFGEMQAEGVLVGNVLVSLQVYAVGMAISVLLAVPLGLAIGGLRKVDRAFSPYLWALYTTPGVILMPLILMWVGINDSARVLLVVVKAFPAIAVVVMEGVKTVDNDLIETSRSFCAGRLDVFRRVIFPSTLPYIGTGLRMGVSRGLVGLFIGELFTSTQGIGYILSLSQARFNTARTFAILLAFIAFSVVLVSASRILERKFSRWRA